MSGTLTNQRIREFYYKYRIAHGQKDTEQSAEATAEWFGITYQRVVDALAEGYRNEQRRAASLNKLDK